jgi:hypothetical protein
MPAPTRRHCRASWGSPDESPSAAEEGLQRGVNESLLGAATRIFAGKKDLAARSGSWNARCRSQKRQNHLKLIELDLPTLTALVPEVRPDVPTNPEILGYDSNARVVDKVE